MDTLEARDPWGIPGLQKFCYKVDLIKVCFKKSSHLGLKVP